MRVEDTLTVDSPAISPCIEEEKGASFFQRLVNLFGQQQREHLKQEAELYRTMLDNTAADQPENHLLQEASVYKKMAG